MNHPYNFCDKCGRRMPGSPGLCSACRGTTSAEGLKGARCPNCSATYFGGDFRKLLSTAKAYACNSCGQSHTHTPIYELERRASGA